MFDHNALETWLYRNVPGFDGPLALSPLKGGLSNFTYAISDGTGRWVLRHPPTRRADISANDLGREVRVMQALATSTIPVPTPIAYSADTDVIGVPFAVIEWVDGVVIRSAYEAATLDSASASRMGRAMVERLAALHMLDPADVGLENLGRPKGFLERQVRRWRGQWDGFVSDATHAVALADRLAAHLPESEARDAAIVHGDYRIDNVMFSLDERATVVAVLDWEMATLGDPLVDVGLLLLYWDPITANLLPGGHPITANPGFPSAQWLGEEYATITGAVLDGIDFYIGLACLKLATIAEGIRLRGVDSSGRVGELVDPLIAHGMERLS